MPTANMTGSRRKNIGTWYYSISFPRYISYRARVRARVFFIVNDTENIDFLLSRWMWLEEMYFEIEDNKRAVVKTTS